MLTFCQPLILVCDSAQAITSARRANGRCDVMAGCASGHGCRDVHLDSVSAPLRATGSRLSDCRDHQLALHSLARPPTAGRTRKSDLQVLMLRGLPRAANGRPGEVA